jgi:hypothetical protein
MKNYFLIFSTFLIVLSEFSFHFDNQPTDSVKFNKKPSLNLNTVEVFDYFFYYISCKMVVQTLDVVFLKYPDSPNVYLK